MSVAWCMILVRERGVDVAPTIRRLTSEDIDRRRQEILDEVGSRSVKELEDRADRYLLTPEERALFDELRDLEFLAHG